MENFNNIWIFGVQTDPEFVIWGEGSTRDSGLESNLTACLIAKRMIDMGKKQTILNPAALMSLASRVQRRSIDSYLISYGLAGRR